MEAAAVAVDRSGDKAVTHLAAGLFFVTLFFGIGFGAVAILMGQSREIMAALRGEAPTRLATRPVLRVTVRPAKPFAGAAPMLRAAA